MEASNADYYAHPVFHRNRLLLRTPAMDALSEELNQWLWTGVTGGYILGASRVGKTTALRTLADEFRSRGNIPLPADFISTPSRDQNTITSVFRAMCWSVGLLVKAHDTADLLSDRYLHHLADRMVESGSESAVLVVDEMQRLVPNQFNAFAEIYDKLELLGLALTVIFVGNDAQCEELLEAIELPENAHVRGRFFTQGLTFLGLTGKKEVASCLGQYDTLRFPPDGPTYTEFFLPEAVRKGWRLASLSTELWRVFRSYQKNYHFDSWGMQYFIATVNTLLTDFLPHYGVDEFNEEMANEAIQISKLVPSSVYEEQ